MSRVLVVEDNPVTRKLLRVALELEGHEVHEAESGAQALTAVERVAPDLVVQDLVLPDMDGEALMAELRKRARQPELPILLVSGLVHRLDELRARSLPATHCLAKPVEPARLIQVVDSIITTRRVEPLPESPSVLALLADPLDGRAAELQLSGAGFQVTHASDVRSALDQARRSPPRAILAGVLLGDRDGFGVCHALRQDAALAGVPVVLISAAELGAEDRAMATAAGADALVMRTPDFGEAAAALIKALEPGRPRPPVAAEAEFEARHKRWLVAEIRRQVRATDDATRRTALQAAVLSFLAAMSEGLVRSRDATRVLGDVLVHCLDAAGLSTGLLYLVEQDGTLALRTASGLRPEARARAERAFDHPELLQKALHFGAPMVLLAGPESGSANDILSRIGQRSALVVPFVVGGEPFGVIVLASDTQDLSDRAWLSFGRNLALQFGQSVALAQSLSRLATSEELHRTLFEELPVGIYRSTLAGEVLEANPAFARLLGFDDVEAVRGVRMSELYVDAEQRSRLTRGLEREGGVQEELSLRRRDGRIIWVLKTGMLRRDADGKALHYQAVLEDVTERREVERRLRESEEQYRLLFDHNPQPMWVYDVEGLGFLAVNDAAVGHYGYSRDEFLRMTIKEIRPEQDVPKLLELIARPLDGAPLRRSGPWRHRTKDGRLRDVEVASSPTELHGRPARLVVATDVTEKRALEAQLLEAQKMESIGRLAGGVAHDFNNLLSVILGYSEALAGRFGAGTPEARRMEEILKAADRAAGLTRQLLAFARRQTIQPTPLDINGVVREMEGMLRRLLGEDLELRTALADGLDAVLADRGQLEQVIMNLAVNARDAMPRGGRLTLETANVELGPGDAERHLGVEPGPHVMLAVSDTGQGMDSETLAHAFEPFFTTKDRDKGTGLGLSTVYGIVKQAGGQIWVYSEPGHGSSFKIYLPRLEGAVPRPTRRPETPAASGGRETILVLEDEPALRELLQEILQEAGYSVLVAGDGEEGLSVARRHAGPLHLLLTDVVMPRMSGREIAARLRLERPGIGVLYMSGYTDNAIVHHGVLEASAAFLQKPVSSDVLLRKVREALGGASHGDSG
jgi:PAS domain S-box-containing protein